jgi:hypothetical protein
MTGATRRTRPGFRDLGVRAHRTVLVHLAGGVPGDVAVCTTDPERRHGI